MEKRRELTRSYATIPAVVTVVAIALLALSTFLPTGNAAAQIQTTNPSPDSNSLKADESIKPLKPHESSPTVATHHHTWGSMAHAAHAERHLIAPLIKNRSGEGHHEASSWDSQHRHSWYRGGDTLGTTPEESFYSAPVPFISNRKEGYVPQSAVNDGKEGGGRRALLLLDGEEGFEVSRTDVYELPNATYLDPEAFLWGNRTDRPEKASQGGGPKGPKRSSRRQRIRDAQGQSTAAVEASAAAAGGEGGLASNVRHHLVGRTPPMYSCDLMLSPEGCRAFAAQTPLPAPLPPRGSKACLGGCGAGNCQYDLGVCMCPAGATGANCELPLKRPCAHR